jgi:predicted  nucleic acid-binding Zn-ribbon protein
MKYNKLNSMTRSFLLGESKSPSLQSYLQALSETLSKLSPRTKSDHRRVEIAKNQLKEIKRHTRKLEESVQHLEEQVRVLEESKTK